jgi:hypothetical protein
LTGIHGSGAEGAEKTRIEVRLQGARQKAVPARIVIAPQPVIRALFVCMSLLIAAGLAGQISTWFLGHDHLLGFVPKFDLGTENSVPTWFSTICLFLCAIALAAIALTEWRGKGPLRVYWFGLAGTFVLLSLDEAASFHEMLTAPLRAALHTGGLLYFAWVIPGGFFVLGFLFLFWKFLSDVPAETRRGLLLAGLAYCSGCLVMEMIGGRYLSLHGEDFNYSLMCVLEESLEMTGVILFLRSLLSYLADHVGSLTVQIQR